MSQLPKNKCEKYLRFCTDVLYGWGSCTNLSAKDVVEYLGHIFLALEGWEMVINFLLHKLR